MRGLLVTGTDTGVGKTWVACAIARALVESGRTVGVLKPCETGVPGGPRPKAFPEGSDAARLADAARCEAPVSDVLPYAYPLPAAPSVAAADHGETIDLAEIDAAYERLRAAHDVVLVEGAGGLLVPLVGAFTFADLGCRLELPVLVVARTGLGTVNHTALTVRAAQVARMDVLGVVLNAVDGATSASDRRNLAALPELIDVPVLAELEHGDAPDATRLTRILALLGGEGTR